MARNNHVFVVGDITSDIYYDHIYLDGKRIAYLRLLMMITPVEGISGVTGLRIVIYGPQAELTYGYVQMGSRLAVNGHIQSRKRETGLLFEVVAREVQYLRNIDWDRGEVVRLDLVSRGELRPSHRDLLPKKEGAADDVALDAETLKCLAME